MSSSYPVSVVCNSPEKQMEDMPTNQFPDCSFVVPQFSLHVLCNSCNCIQRFLSTKVLFPPFGAGNWVNHYPEDSFRMWFEEKDEGLFGFPSFVVSILTKFWRLWVIVWNSSECGHTYQNSLLLGLCQPVQNMSGILARLAHLSQLFHPLLNHRQRILICNGNC